MSLTWDRSCCARNPDNVEDAALAIEALVPVSIAGLAEGRQRYALFTNDAGGIMDDLMVANRGDHLFVVVNAACKEADEAHMRAHLSDSCEIDVVTDRALLALQGPSAEAALAAIAPDVAAMKFMDVACIPSAFGELWVSRSGYTGEDGYEVSVADRRRAALPEACWQQDVEPIGLGARDSLRLEAGLCLYGSDLDETTSPVEAALTWAIQKVRRRGGSARRRISRSVANSWRIGKWCRPHTDRAFARRPRADARRHATFCKRGCRRTDWRSDLGRLWALNRTTDVDGLCRQPIPGDRNTDLGRSPRSPTSCHRRRDAVPAINLQTLTGKETTDEIHRRARMATCRR